MIASVLKALDILDIFSPTEPRLSLAEISRRLNMPRSTTHNLIKTLASRGYLEKVSDDQYALGTAIIELTQSVRVNVELRDRSAPLLRQLADICRESLYLAVPSGDSMLYIYAIESPRRLLARSAVGDRFYFHSTAVGKAVLATLPPSEVKAIVERTGLPKVSEFTVSNLDTLFEDLEKTRKRGYSIDAGENRNGIYCIGAPVLDAQSRAIGACSISGADPEIVTSRLPMLTHHLLATVEEMSRRMGYVPISPPSMNHLPVDLLQGT